VFTADIPSAFLDRFDFPTLVPSASVGFSIRHLIVRYKPYRTLSTRLLALIVPDSYLSPEKGDEKERDHGEDARDATTALTPGLMDELADQAVPDGRGVTSLDDAAQPS
jgi:hypothetical protein